MTDASDRRGITPDNPESLMFEDDDGSLSPVVLGGEYEVERGAERPPGDGLPTRVLFGDPAQPPPGDQPLRAFDQAAAAVVLSLTTVTQRLTELRAHRDETEAEIRVLVAEKELLERMGRIVERAQTDG